MKLIRKRLYICSGVTAFGAFVCVPMVIKAGSSCQTAEIMLFLGIAITILFAGYSLLEYKRLKAALLIIENQILYICPVMIDTGEPGATNADCPAESIEVFISCFGILLDSRIIKFNQEGVYLRAVKIGCDFISLTYGTDKKIQTTRLLLHGKIESGELADIVEKFRYETGIVPTITN